MPIARKSEMKKVSLSNSGGLSPEPCKARHFRGIGVSVERGSDDIALVVERVGSAGEARRGWVSKLGVLNPDSDITQRVFVM